MTVPRPGGFPATSGCRDYAVQLNSSEETVAVVEASCTAEAREFFEAVRGLVGVEWHATVHLD